MKKISVFLVLLGAICYGAQSSIVKILYDYGLTMWQVLLLEYTLGSIIFLLYVLVKERKAFFSLTWMEIVKLSLLAILGPGLTSVFYYLALTYLPASLGVIFLFQYLLFIILFEKIFNRSVLSLLQVAAVMLIFLGTFLAVDGFSINVSSLHWKGAIFGVLSAFTYAIFLFFTKKVSTISTPVVRSTIVAVSIMIAAMLIKNPIEVFSNIEPSISTFLLLGIIVTLMGQVIPLIAFNIGVPNVGSQLASILGAVELLAAIIFSSILLAEQIKMTQWFGIILITLAIIVSEIKFTPKGKKEKSLNHEGEESPFHADFTDCEEERKKDHLDE